MSKKKSGFDRRSLLQGTATALGLAPLAAAPAPQAAAQTPAQRPRAGETVEPAGRLKGAKEIIRITKLETFLVKPRWLFLKIHTNAGIVGLGEPIVEGRAKTVAAAVEEIAPYLIGKDPRPVVASLAGDVPARLLSRRARC